MIFYLKKKERRVEEARYVGKMNLEEFEGQVQHLCLETRSHLELGKNNGMIHAVSLQNSTHPTFLFNSLSSHSQTSKTMNDSIENIHEFIVRYIFNKNGQM